MYKCLPQDACSSSSSHKRKLLPRWPQPCLAFGWLLLGSLAAAQAIPLATLKPRSVLSFYPGRDATPRAATVAVAGHSPAGTLSMMAESEVSYNVPEGESCFEGSLFYQADAKTYTPLLIRIWDDGKLIWERGIQGNGPPIAFSLRVSPASQLVIEAEAPWVTSFYLTDAQFTRNPPRSSAVYVPTAAEGYVDYGPLPRQQVLGIYHPGESVPVTAYFSGAADKAALDIHLRPSAPAYSAALSETHLDIPLRSLDSTGVVQGTDSWTVPSTQGPAMLHVKETVAGRVVFERQVRIAIGPKFSLAEQTDSLWGVHLSGAGYPAIFDQFAGLWGAKWGRVFLRWPVIEQRAGDYDFDRIDKLVETYRSQNMRILMVIGENAPAWAGAPGPQYYLAWNHFVSTAVRHLSGKVDAWEIFNEVDAKYYDALRSFEPDWDVKTMRIAMEATHANDPKSPAICCSTVTSSWVTYNRRIFQEGLLSGIDIVSLHPYQHGPPELKDGQFNYFDRLTTLSNVVRTFHANKPIWATEDNWIIGEPGDTSVPEPAMSEQEQSEYVVRVNLLSAAKNVRFFLHSPYAHAHHTQIHLSTWAAYAQMASFFSGTNNLQLAESGPQVFAVMTDSNAGQLGALWAAYGQTTLRLEGGKNYRFFDMYGNPLRLSPDSVSVSVSPIYYQAQGSSQIKLSGTAGATAFKKIAGFDSWACASQSSCKSVAGGMNVQSAPSTGAFQLVSPVNHSASGSCQVARIQVNVKEGKIAFYATDAADGKRISPPILVDVTDGEPQSLELRFRAGNSGAFKLILANANAEAAVSTFTVLDPPEIATCP